MRRNNEREGRFGDCIDADADADCDQHDKATTIAAMMIRMLTAMTANFFVGQEQSEREEQHEES